MDDLRFVRREDQSLIVATDSGQEYRVLVDEAVLAELRHLSRPARGAARINPREVQALIRAGKTRAEVAEATGLDEADVERYEEPVLAERRYVLELAQAVAVRTSPGDEAEQQFGTVIAERLIGLGAETSEWNSWRDEEAGWMIGLTFSSRDADEHRAVWSFEHRKGVLSPLTPDAHSLSKQGSVGDRLIPKLRAVDTNERFDSGAFDIDASAVGADAEANETPRVPSGPVAPDHPSTGSIPVVDIESEYARRQHIDERAIKTPTPELPDLGQTADLLDALRRRRGERESSGEGPGSTADGAVEEAPGAEEDRSDAAPVTPIGAANHAHRSGIATDGAATGAPAEDEEDQRTEAGEGAATDSDDQLPKQQPLGPAPEKGKRGGKGRATIPSWDDILFGIRSEDDPA